MNERKNLELKIHYISINIFLFILQKVPRKPQQTQLSI